MGTKHRFIALAMAAVIVTAGCASPPSEPLAKPAGPTLRIEIVDFYGLGRLTQADARAAMALKEGDTIPLDGESRPAAMGESERRLKALPGVVNAHLSLVCCEAGGGIVYVAVQDKDSPTLRFRPEPQGPERLPDEVVKTGQEFIDTLTAAVQRGESTEELWQGQSVMRDPAARGVQMRFIEFARKPQPFRDVLRNSADSGHRALAAQILGFVTNKRTVIDDLVYAMDDPSEDVRNNAMRALAVMARTSSGPSRDAARIPPEPFVALLGSPVWSDRNKASFALLELSESRDPELIRYLRRQALVPLTEMARWKSEGHAMPAFMILGRIAGRSDDEIQTAWTQGQRDELVESALKSSW